MPTVSNTSPLLNLAIIDHLDLLRQQFDRLVIPTAVLDECKLDMGYPGSNQIEQAIASGWIEVANAHNRPLVQILRTELDLGEAEAIALAIERGDVEILMDEREGRQKAKALGLSPIGVLGVLLQAKKDGAIDFVREAIEKLQILAGFRLTSDLVDQILESAGEFDVH